MSHKLFITLLVSFLCSFALQATKVDSLLKVLDRTIMDNERYESRKKKEIESLKRGLNEEKISDSLRFHLYDALFDNYQSYICDSARHYLQLNIAHCKKMGNNYWLNESYIHLARILASSSLFPEATDMLMKVDRHYLHNDDLINYYSVWESLYLYQSEYTDDDPEYRSYYAAQRELYRDSVIALAEKTYYRYEATKGGKWLDRGYLQEADALLYKADLMTGPGTRNYAIATAVLSDVYRQEGNLEKSQEFLIMSAISDVEAVVKENNSIRTLANIMFEQGEIDRANRYVKESMENANTFNARLRNLQASKMLTIIDSAYSKEIQRQQKRLQNLLLIISIIPIALVITVVVVIVQLRKLATARRALQSANDAQHKLIGELNSMNQLIQEQNSELTVANNIKEEYIGRFLSQCSLYIDKLDEFRRTLNKLLSGNKTDDVRKLVKSSQIVEEEVKAFYQNFDSAFLKIYPNFVQEFNALMQPDCQIVPKRSELLTTELRIFALIRLGFTDSSKIASMLRHSITTIYTYRSKTKSRALNGETFEHDIQKIASI